MPPVILCIDRRELNLFTERRILESAGYRVLTASNCDDGAQLLTTDYADVVLLSDDLSSDDDAAACARLRRIQPWTRIVLQRTAFFDPEVPTGADITIPKTTHPEEKLRIIDSLLMQKAA